MIHLVSSTNNDGYFSALFHTWQKCAAQKNANVPAKSSFSEYRQKVSYTFFEDAFDQHLEAIDSRRAKIRGYYVYAVDGDQLDVMPSRDFLNSGLRGTLCPGSENETHVLKMHTVQVYDVVNGLVKDFNYSNQIAESPLAQAMIEGLETNSIAIYDRFYCGYATMFAHEMNGSKFVIRARFEGEGSNVQKDILKFARSKKKSVWITWQPNWFHRGHPEIRLRLIKIKNPRTKKIMILMTNISENEFANNEVGELYQRRWDVEGSFRDLTSILKMEQWHSKKINGILQEIFALFWLVNVVKFNCFRAHHNARSWLKRRYRKANVKLCIKIFVEHIALNFTADGRRKLKNLIEEWLIRSTENRERLSRSYPRVQRQRGRIYQKQNMVPRRS